MACRQKSRRSASTESSTVKHMEKASNLSLGIRLFGLYDMDAEASTNVCENNCNLAADRNYHFFLHGKLNSTVLNVQMYIEIRCSCRFITCSLIITIGAVTPNNSDVGKRGTSFTKLEAMRSASTRSLARRLRLAYFIAVNTEFSFERQAL